MAPETILNGLQSLQQAGLFRTPKKFGDIGEFWFQKFKNMPDSQYLFAINAIVDNESTWPSIATIYKYATNWTGDEKKEAKCPFCEGVGMLLIKSQSKDIAYSCKCVTGKLRQVNLKIASYKSLGIPWPEIDDKPTRSDKMTTDNQKRIDGFLERIGSKIDE